MNSTNNVYCPVCHSKLIYYTTITVIGVSYYYCPSLKCKVRRVVVYNGKIVHFERYSSIEKKKQYMYRHLRSAMRNGNGNYRKKVIEKYRLLKKSIER